MGFFILQSIFTLGLDFMLIYLRLNSGKGLDAIFPSLSFFDLAGLAASTLSSTLVLYAILKMKSSRLEAYKIFKNAILVQIFIVQVVLFYLTQFIALLGLAGNICILLVLNYMIIQETNASRGQVNSLEDREKRILASS